MSGIKRELEDKDPDYEDISMVHQSKRFKVTEQTAREAAVQKIEIIMKEQFGVEMKNKEHEIEIIDQRLNEARRMMDKLRAYIVANYYASAGQSKTEPFKPCDPSVFNHPAIKKFIESPSRSSSPANQRSDTPSANQSESESISHINEYLPDRESGGYAKEERHLDKQEKRPGRNTGQDTFGVTTSQASEQRCTTYLSSSDDPSRLYVKKTVVVGNVSKYIPPDKREENDQSTHKWMVYVRGSRKEPRIDHFVKKVWFFLHPSYKPNDLVEVSEPPFHLTRRGWGEFPVRVQIHFKDSRNKRIDIIHNLKLDRTYTGLQTLGAETVVDVDVCRSFLGEEYIPPFPSTKHQQAEETSVFKPSTVSAVPLTTIASSQVYSPVRLSHESQARMSVEKGFPIKSESGRSSTYSLASSLERTPTKLTTQKIALGSHGNSAFQPITASCKIIPLSQASNPVESPSKSFQPITVSCKIVSGSPISTPSQSPLPRTPSSTPVHMKQGTSGSTISNQYLTVDKPAQVVGVSASNTGSPSSKQCSVSQAALDARSPVPRVHGSSFVTSTIKQEESLFAAMPPLCPIGSHSKLQSPKLVTSGGTGPFTKVIIKQEPGEITPQLPSHPPVSTPASQQLITVKTGQVIAVSPQKQASSVTEGVGQTKVVSIPVGSALQTVKQAVAISGGQILVAKSNTATAKTLGQKQVIAQGVAKAIVSGAGTTILAQPVQTVTKAQISSTGPQKTGTQGSVMATLQLPATNLANLANLPPGTKLYLTTNSKNPSGKGKLLLIPQGAILRASSNTGQQSSASSSSTGTAATTTSGFPQHLTYNSYVLKQTPQGTFLVGQPSSQASAKQAATGTLASTGTSQGGASVSQGQPQTLRVAGGQKATILTQVVAGGQTTSIKVHEGTVKQAPITAHVSRPGTTTLRVAGGVITAASTSTAVCSSSLEGSNLNSSTISIPLVKTTSHQYQPVFVSQGQTVGAGTAKSGTAASVVTSSSIGTAVKTTASVTGMLKIQSGQASTQQAVLTIPASQLKQLGVSTTAGGVQTILMPVSKVIQPQSTSKAAPVAINTTVATTTTTTATAAATTTTTTVSASSSTTTQSHSTVPVTKVKTEPGIITQPCSAAPPSTAATLVKVEQSTEAVTIQCNIDTEHLENTRQLLTSVVKKCPLIAGEKTEECSPVCATSLEQYYNWNIGKRRAAEWQRAVTVRKILLDVVEKCPRFTDVSLLKTKHIVQWCRQRGYTPPDLESVRNDMDSLEDILTQIDSEPECPSSYSTAEEICQKLEQLHRFMKSEPESDEEVDIINVVKTVKVKVKKEKEEEDDEPRIYIGATPAAEMVRETVQQIGISLQPVQLEKNVYSPVVEDMIVKATERFVSDVLREALAIALQKVPHHRVPREISAVNIHQAICSIPEYDFLTNKFMGHLNEERYAGPSK